MPGAIEVRQALVLYLCVVAFHYAELVDVNQLLTRYEILPKRSLE